MKELIIFSRDEKKQEELRNKIENPKVKFIIGDVRNLDYNLYEDLGNKKRIKFTDYNSDSTNQLNIKEIISLLKSIKVDLN